MSVAIGVPLLELGDIRSETEYVTMPMNDRDRITTLIREYFTAPNGKQYLIGTNEHRIIRHQWHLRSVDYNYGELLGEDNTWLCLREECDLLLDDPGHVVIGLVLDEVELASGQIVYPSDIEDTRAKVAAFLRERFGYDGEVWILPR